MKICSSFRISMIACTVSSFNFSFHVKYALGMQEWLKRDASKNIPRFPLPCASVPIWKLFTSKRSWSVGRLPGQLSVSKASRDLGRRLKFPPCERQKSAFSSRIGVPRGISLAALRPTPPRQLNFLNMLLLYVGANAILCNADCNSC